MEWYVAMIGKYFVRDYKPGFGVISWNTLDANEATRYTSSELAEKAARDRIRIDGYPVEPLISSIQILKVRLSFENLPLGNTGSDNTSQVGQTNSYPIPQDLGC